MNTVVGRGLVLLGAPLDLEELLERVLRLPDRRRRRGRGWLRRGGGRWEEPPPERPRQGQHHGGGSSGVLQHNGSDQGIRAREESDSWCVCGEREEASEIPAAAAAASDPLERWGWEGFRCDATCERVFAWKSSASTRVGTDSVDQLLFPSAALLYELCFMQLQVSSIRCRGDQAFLSPKLV